MRLPQQLYKRKKDSHKGDFGHVFILAGSLSMPGAALLASRATLRAGAGLVTLGIPKSIASCMIANTPEIMVLPLPETQEGTISESAYEKIKTFLPKYSVMLIGPGLSRNPQTQDVIRKLIGYSELRAVIDADAINAWAGHTETFKLDVASLSFDDYKFKIITPHPGEISRLLNISVEEIQKNRKEIAKDFAREYNLVVVLKGHNTIICDPKGKIYINKTGNSGMSTAGCGDVLSGIIASFLAQGLNSFEAAKSAVYLHGLAGDLAAKDKTQLGLIASDIIEYLPEAFKKTISKS